MKLNERGSSLVTVLMVVLIFSVLGMALMGNVINENKRVMATESDVQARYLAENGLTYFEKDFQVSIPDIKAQLKERVKKQTEPNIVQIDDLGAFAAEEFILSQYPNEIPVGDSSNPNETKIKAELITSNGEKVIKVTSTGTSGSKVKKLIGYYKPNISIDFDTPKFKFANFEGRAIDFSDNSAIGLNLLSAVSLSLFQFDRTKDENHNYRVPDDELLKLNFLNSLGINLGVGNRFQMMEKYPILATRKNTLLGAKVLKTNEYPLVTADLLTYKDDQPTNVLIDGSYNVFDALVFKYVKYQDINFKKLAVMGNAIIQQDKYNEFTYGYVDEGNKNNGGGNNSSPRTFSFEDGLYVNKSLVIGDSPGGVGNLKILGDIVVIGNLLIKDIDLIMGPKKGNEAIYVDGDVTITNSCLSSEPDSFQSRIFAKGEITINVGQDCSNKFNAVLYSEKGIKINNKGKELLYKGGLIGDVTGKENLKFGERNANYLDILQLKGSLTPKGREFQK